MVVGDLPEKKDLIVKHFLSDELKIVDDLKVSNPIFEIIFSLRVIHLVPKLFDFNSSAFLKCVHDLFNIRSHNVLVDTEDISFSRELLLLRQMLNDC